LENFYNCIEEIKDALSVCADPDQAFDFFQRFLENTTAKSTLFEIIKSPNFIEICFLTYSPKAIVFLYY
jgi:glutamate-ammonia-ligase adenylyltransferase